MTQFKSVDEVPYDGELHNIGTLLIRRWIDDTGQKHEASMRAHSKTRIDIDQRENPTAYQRSYYRRVRRYRDRRKPRVPDD